MLSTLLFQNIETIVIDIKIHSLKCLINNSKVRKTKTYNFWEISMRILNNIFVQSQIVWRMMQTKLHQLKVPAKNYKVLNGDFSDKIHDQFIIYTFKILVEYSFENIHIYWI